MRITRIKEDVTALSYEIMRRNGLSVRFRVKTYYETLNNRTNYYYNEYTYNSNSKLKSSIVLSPKTYVQFDFGVDDGKKIFFLQEVHKNKMVRRLAQMVQLLEAYECGEIDIIKVDESGTHISNNFPREIKMKLGSNTAMFTVGIREDKLDIGVTICFNDMKATIALHDFLDLITKLAGLNYTMMGMLLLNHIGAPELGSHETDFRPEKIMSNEDRSKEIDSIASSKSSISQLQSNKQPFNKPKW